MDVCSKPRSEGKERGRAARRQLLRSQGEMERTFAQTAIRGSIIIEFRTAKKRATNTMKNYELPLIYLIYNMSVINNAK